MEFLVRWLHLLALSLWLGGGVFFSVFTALPIIRHMETLAQTPGNWPGFTDKKQGTRMAGEALTAVFANYFPYQAVCGIAGLGTALMWVRRPGSRPRLRVMLLAAALLLVLVNLILLSPWVHELRQQRYSADATLAELAEATFAQVHQLSLLADLSTLGLVFAALLLAVSPEALPPPSPS